MSLWTSEYVFLVDSLSSWLFRGGGLFYLVLFPLIYGLPRAVFGCVKGVYKWGIVRRLIVVPAIWSVLCAAVIGEALATNSNLITGLLSKPGILWGGWAALAFGGCAAFPVTLSNATSTGNLRNTSARPASSGHGENAQPRRPLNDHRLKGGGFWGG